MNLKENHRFWAKVDKSGDCWVWTAALSIGGYGKFNLDGRTSVSHRMTYEDTFGPIPKGMQIDHRCHNRKCVNPEHLRLVTPKQNAEHKSGAQANSQSGVRGVHRSAQHTRWVAQVRHNNKTLHVGLFGTIEEAEAAVIARRNELFTHNDVDRKELTL